MSDIDTTARTESGNSPTGADSANPLPTNWREALFSLIAARVALIQVESKQAAKAGAGKAVRMVAAVICVFFTWALVLAGSIGAIAHQTGWPWFWIALATAALHLLGAIILFQTCKGPASPTFTATRAEFQKDREWIETFQKSPKSNG